MKGAQMEMETRLMGNGITISISHSDENELQVQIHFEGSLISETQVTTHGYGSVRVGDGVPIHNEALTEVIRERH
jgi:hypothetical protein